MGRWQIRDPAAYFQSGPNQAIGLLLGIRGDLVYPQLAPEAGIHLFIEGRDNYKCLVHISQLTREDYRPPPGVERQGRLPSSNPLRTYDAASARIKDAAAGSMPWRTSDVSTILERLIGERHRKAMEALIRA
jgi:hypothetical protein